MRRVGLALLSALAVAGAALSAPDPGGMAFRDSTGEDPLAPDVTFVRVSNGDGLVTFRIATPNRPALTGDMRFRVWIDSDLDRTTGLTVAGLEGRDHFLLWDRGDLKVFSCDGTSCTGSARPPESLRLTYASGPAFTVARDELGDPDRLRFSVEVGDGIEGDPATGFDVANARWDFAPDDRARLWSYALAPSRLLAERFSTSPARPLAGERFRVQLLATRSDTGVAVRSGRVTCRAAVAGRAVRPSSQRFAGSRATCVFAVPRGAAGRVLRGSIAVEFRGRTLVKTFVRTVR